VHAHGAFKFCHERGRERESARGGGKGQMGGGEIGARGKEWIERERGDREGKRGEIGRERGERQREGVRAGAGERDCVVSAGSVCLGVQLAALIFLLLHVSTPKRRTVHSRVTHAHDAHEHAESHLVESGCARLGGYLSGYHKGLAPVHFYKRACLDKDIIKDDSHHAHTHVQRWHALANAHAQQARIKSHAHVNQKGNARLQHRQA
jgi:hypothetical protein